MARARASYSNQALQRAVQEVLDGRSINEVCRDTGIPYSSLCKWVAAAKRGEKREPKRRGPAPILPAEAEMHLHEWIVGRQQVGYPAERREIMRKAGAISELMTGERVGPGWYRRFLQRHPTLSVRSTQSLARTRNNVTKSDMRSLFGVLLKLLVENNLQPSQIFNMDETAFETRKKSKKVVALRGSSNVWNTDVTTSFHMTVVACGSACGSAVPPLFILPGKRVHLTVMNWCEVPGAVVTTTPTAFMNASLFARWLRFFASSVPSSVPRPLLLILDGCSSHYSLEVFETAEQLSILLVFLPANATHLFQPLDVAVFGVFKGKLRALVDEFVGDSGEVTLDKATAIRLASMAWSACNFETNIKAGFKACGLFPLSLPTMYEGIENFQRNGAPRDVRIAQWLKIKDMVEERMLVLPPPKQKKRGRKRCTVDVAGQLLTRELLIRVDIEANKPNRRARRGDVAESDNDEADGELTEAVV